MDNAIQYSVALSMKVKAIVSFDRDFDNLEISRKELKDIINSDITCFNFMELPNFLS